MWQSWVLLQSFFKIELQVRIGGADYVAIALSNPQWCSHGRHAPCGLPPAVEEHSRGTTAMPFLPKAGLLQQGTLAQGVPISLAKTFSELPCNWHLPVQSTFASSPPSQRSDLPHDPSLSPTAPVTLPFILHRHF